MFTTKSAALTGLPTIKSGALDYSEKPSVDTEREMLKELLKAKLGVSQDEIQGLSDGVNEYDSNIIGEAMKMRQRLPENMKYSNPKVNDAFNKLMEHAIEIQGLNGDQRAINR